MRKIFLATIALGLVVAATVTGGRDASADLYSSCMVKSTRWAMDNLWLNVGPGVMIQATQGACGRYIMRV